MNNTKVNNKLILCLTILLAIGTQSCCVLFPNFRTSTVTVSVTPSNADIYRGSAKIGTGKATIGFDCDDAKYATKTITMQAPGYRKQTAKLSNYRYSYSKNYTLEKKVNTYVNVSVEPSNASISYKDGNSLGSGSCTLTFDEDDKPNSYYELYIEAPYHYGQIVKVFKSDVNKNISLTRMPIKTVVVIPGDAEIAVNNEVVGKGKHDISFENRDKVLLTFSCIGYETTTVTLFRNDVEQTKTYELDIDEAYENSIGGETAAQFANKWVPITARKDLSEDEIWVRMMSIVRENFEQIEKTDKASKWIKTFPTITPYKASDVRTTLEISPSYSTGELQYKVRLYFEKRKKGSGEEGWQKYDRLLKIYKDVIPNLINSIGGGM